ncbi:amidohydrolase [Streptomyces sp. NBC_00083]|uniref:amidohydrolase n=1 Tax=Streptomyces sp. NBC_00083 TaxID=2975647 RepID=UPI0022505D8A|nr:amidohydrolase [Streptomyces sp. NBC_00083]MCX5386281.1 amidohydrolase [Streptomyces sp. NBC_00083]
MLCTRLTNANIVTMDPGHPVAHDLGIWRGRIVGLDEAVTSLPAREVVDLRGATVLPGFIDSHVHLAWAGFKRSAPSVAPCERVDEVLAVIGRAAARTGAPGDWVDVMGYDQRALGRHLTAAELDTVSHGRKVFLMHDSGHGCVVNSAVLALLPFEVPHQGGFLAESAMTAARRLRLPYAQSDIADAVERAARSCLAEGVTAVAEAGIGGGLLGHSPVELGAYQLLRDQGRLPLRVQLMAAADTLRPREAHPRDGLPRALDLGMRTGFGDDWLSLGALKVYTDGGMMARTAALTAPYTGTDRTGQLQDDPERLTQLIVDGHLAGWQLAVHAIGDRAADLALDALEHAQRLRPRPDARHRIEHAGLVRPDQLPRFARLGVGAVIQPTFLHSFGDDYARVMGEERTPWMYRGRSFLDHGVTLVGSSDRPVTDGAPLRGIQFLVERAAASGQLIGPREALTVDEALHAYTVAGAHACRWDADAGTLAPGRRADLVVLGDDPRRVDTSRIADIEIVATFVDGHEATETGKL